MEEAQSLLTHRPEARRVFEVRIRTAKGVLGKSLDPSWAVECGWFCGQQVLQVSRGWAPLPASLHGDSGGPVANDLETRKYTGEEIPQEVVVTLQTGPEWGKVGDLRDFSTVTALGV